MAPVRRYLRITKYTVLECRIYVDNPALVASWLLHPRDPALPRVIESVRPLVVPKLMEERERARHKGAKKKGAIRDVVVEADFEVALFLTEAAGTRHSLLYKHRRARDKTQTRLVSNSHRLTGTAPGAAGPEAGPIDVDRDAGAGDGTSPHLHVDLGEDGGHEDADDEEIVLTAGRRQRPSEQPPPNLLREESDDEPTLPLDIIPDIRTATQRPKRPRRQKKAIPVRDSDDEEEEDDDDDEDKDDDDDDQESLFVSGDDDEEDGDGGDGPPAKRARVAASALESADTALDPLPGGLDDGDGDGRKKKKIVMDVVYEGFAIYGRVLCLVVKRRGGPAGRGGGGAGGSGAPARPRTLDAMLTPPQSSTAAAASATSASAAAASAPAASADPAASDQPGGLASMENWIASTQMPAGAEDDDDDDGEGV